MQASDGGGGGGGGGQHHYSPQQNHYYPTVMTSAYERLTLYILPDRFYIEPRDRDGGPSDAIYLEIDRLQDTMRVIPSASTQIPVAQADIQSIHAIVGIVDLISGPALVVVRHAEVVAQLNEHDIWKVRTTETIPFRTSTAFLTKKQINDERQLTEMLTGVLATPSFYFSTSLDISRSLQWLGQNATPGFRQQTLFARADAQFVWNYHATRRVHAVQGAARFCLPLILGFVGVRRIRLPSSGRMFQLMLLSRRSTNRAGVRFFKRGADSEGHVANFVETEQIVQVDEKQGDMTGRAITSFLLLRGSIPLAWQQAPNLAWQPEPSIRNGVDQLDVFVRHMRELNSLHPGQHVIVDLVNQKGRELKIGGQLSRIARQACLPFVRHHAFDFHKECHAMNWARLSLLADQLRPEVEKFGFFGCLFATPDRNRWQSGWFRVNCMDCLDRTNVVQSVIAKESLKLQLVYLGLLPQGAASVPIPELEAEVNDLWADNGDDCSRQYAGTPALKGDFTRRGKRTMQGALADGVNAVTRYFRNNFLDGTRQDAIDVWLGNVALDDSTTGGSTSGSSLSLSDDWSRKQQQQPLLQHKLSSSSLVSSSSGRGRSLPDELSQPLPLKFDTHGLVVAAAIFAMAMVVLCLLLAESYSFTFFWFAILFFCILFIFVHGEEFVNKPKLKIE